MKKLLLTIGVFLILLALSVLVMNSDRLIDWTIKYEAKSGKEFPIPFVSAGNCRVKAVEKAYELKNATIMFIKNKSIHTIAIDENKTVYDLSDSAINYQEKHKDINLNGMKLAIYKTYVSLDNIIYQVDLKDKKIMSSTEVLSQDSDSKASVYQNYVSVFIKEKSMERN